MPGEAAPSRAEPPPPSGPERLLRNKTIARCECPGQVSEARELRALLSGAPGAGSRGERPEAVRRLRAPGRRSLRFPESQKIRSPRALRALPPPLRASRVSASPRLRPRSPRASIPASLAGEMRPRSVRESGHVGVCVFVLFITFICRPKAVGTYIFKYKLLLYCIFPSHRSAARDLKYIPSAFYK